MPKQSLNINDFSGGFNSRVDKRDLEENQSSLLLDVVSYNKGSLQHAGAFVPAFSENVAGYSTNINSSTIDNWYIHPSQGFMKFQIGTISVTTDDDATVTSANHGLSINASIVIMNATEDSTLEGRTFIIHTILDDSFHITLPQDDTLNENITYAIGASFVQGEWSDELELNEISPNKSKYILK